MLIELFRHIKTTDMVVMGLKFFKEIVVVVAHKMKKPTKCKNGMLSQSGASSFAA